MSYVHPQDFGTACCLPGDFDGQDPKSQREIDQLPPQEAKRYNDATRAEFNEMKKKQVMELVPASSIPSATKIYPSVVNWTTKKVFGSILKLNAGYASVATDTTKPSLIALRPR
jgi:hypothetical protein